MAKIGTAHIEIKPVIDEEALGVIIERLAAAVAEGVARGMRESSRVQIQVQSGTAGTAGSTITWQPPQPGPGIQA